MFFLSLKAFDELLWGFFGFALLIFLGLYFSYHTRFFQIWAIPSLFRQFTSYLVNKHDSSKGIHPIKILFASVGGTVGIGNLVGIVTAVQLGGPGALFWAWIAAIAGSLVKYSEVYLGLKHRVPSKEGGYNGGPMYFLQKAFKTTWIPLAVSALLCVYGVEIYQFNIVVDSIAVNWGWSRPLVAAFLTIAVIWAGWGGVKRVAKVSTYLLPVFIFAYLVMGFWVLFLNIGQLGSLFSLVLQSAFTGHAAIGGFAGSTLLLTLQQGIARSAYSADIGIGNDSVIQSESSLSDPKEQARLSIVGVIIDNFVCTMSIFLVLVTGVWQTDIPASNMIQTVLASHFPGMHLFIPLFLLILGYTTTIAYFTVGLKAASFIHPEKGFLFYYPLAGALLFTFSFFDQNLPLLIMSISGGLLVVVNLFGIVRLRREVEF